MDPQYYDYFSSAFGGELADTEWHEFAPDALDEQLRQLISSADDRLRSERGVGLRPDAKLFLLINFREMIARPLDARGPGDVRGELFDALADDVWAVTAAAGEEADEDEISGHQVVNALTRSWDKIRTVRLGLWDTHR